MTEVRDSNEGEVVHYLPHHAVLKEESPMTKLRVVFDWSCSTFSGISLNDVLRFGPTIQQDLLYILLRFRKHQYVLTADIQKMYRQILLQKDQRDLQKIIWRHDRDKPIRLNTYVWAVQLVVSGYKISVTTAIENQEKYLKTSEIIRKDFYIDDVLTGDEDARNL